MGIFDVPQKVLKAICSSCSMRVPVPRRLGVPRGGPVQVQGWSLSQPLTAVRPSNRLQGLMERRGWLP